MKVNSAEQMALCGERPSLDELVERTHSLLPQVRAAARETEKNRRVSGEMIAKFADLDLLRLVKPKSFGGFEYGPSALIRVGCEIGRVCGSTAWCVMLGNINGWFTSYWPIEAQNDVWAQAPANLITGLGVPTGNSEEVEGGYNIWGRWPFGSNCDNSQWHFLSCMLPENKGMGWFLVPGDTVQIDQSSWQVAGMAGSGSKTLYSDDKVFVPVHRMINASAVMGGMSPGMEIDGNIMAHFAFPTFGGVALAAPIVGMAQGALDWFIEVMPKKALAPTRPGAPPVGANSPFIQERAGRASAMIDSAKGMLLSSVEEAEQIIFAGGKLTVAQRVTIRRNIAFAASQSVEAVNMLFEASGASSTDLDIPIQRFWRDANAAARHVTFEPTAVFPMVGQSLFGIAPNGTH